MIYFDVIELVFVNGGFFQIIKLYYSVGGLSDYMKLQVVELFCLLFKDEVRCVGCLFELLENILNCYLFLGLGFGICIFGEVIVEKVCVLQEVDVIFINGLKEYDLYNEVWQVGVILFLV